MRKQKMIRAILKRPEEKYGHAIQIQNSNEAFQEMVGNYYEVVSLVVPATGQEACYILNEFGRVHEDPQCNLPFFGTILVVGRDGENFCDCPFSMRFWEKIVRGEV